MLLAQFPVSFPKQSHRFKTHDHLENRRLLWHGTNIAVVAAILKSGLRIMPHSGGRVGKGIYFASENSKSAGYGETTFIIILPFANSPCYCFLYPKSNTREGETREPVWCNG